MEKPSRSAAPEVGAPVPVPALYAWPPRPLGALKWLLGEYLFPWVYLFAALAIVSWYFLTPDLAVMKVLSWEWIALIWLRNAALLTLFAAPLHWWLYIRQGQQDQTKLNKKWQPRNSPRFLFNSQLKDNLFWSLVSGVTIWTLYESMTYWLYANNYVQLVEWKGSEIYLLIMGVLTIFWSSAHFYFVHRLLHWPPLYRVAHALHHKNNSPQPWSGISMHPIEHGLYFSVFVLFWFLPVHPVLVILLGFFQGISPAISHSGFQEVRLGKHLKIAAGDPFHQIHHKYYEVNYGNKPAPFDKLFGSWHDGTVEAKRAFRMQRAQTLKG